MGLVQVPKGVNVWSLFYTRSGWNHNWYMKKRSILNIT